MFVVELIPRAVTASLTPKELIFTNVELVEDEEALLLEELVDELALDGLDDEVEELALVLDELADEEAEVELVVFMALAMDADEEEEAVDDDDEETFDDLGPRVI